MENLKQQIFDSGLKHSYLAEKLGMSKQLFSYHLKKNNFKHSQINIILTELSFKRIDKTYLRMHKQADDFIKFLDSINKKGSN